MTMKRKAPPSQQRDRRDRDVVTLADLAPRQSVTGGSERRVFGADPLVRANDIADARAAARDVKGGKKATK
jgi:hypothetical protein